jgi:ABC-type polysaccharide/polyol phosphate transport system ATPase subunit
MNVIEVRGVAKAFWIPSVRRNTVREHIFGLLKPRRFQRLPVLDDVELTVRRGEALGIMGRNGSGKSTLLKVLCGIYPPDRGAVAIHAPITPVLELGVGWNPELDAIDNILLIGSVMGMPLADIRRNMQEILAFAELERFAGMKLKHYSSGMSERLGYAVAFKAVREVLVLDEIFAVGDAGFKARCEQRYRELRALGRTAIIVSHDPRIIASFCDRAVLLDAGRIVFDGTPRQVADRYVTLAQTPAAPAPAVPLAG